ncbi:MAG TPA: histidine phosphatase family protein [Anaerolineae bacterium]|nr:histidine phosphatase family protein [Anaerolineae bacterium]
MKTVLLLRHAKSSWDDSGLADFERPLAKRGKKDAPRIGEVLADFEMVPDIILSSPAVRAKETAELVAETSGYRHSIEWHHGFYGGGSEDLISALQRLPNKIERAMLVGHNPTMEETVATLVTGHLTELHDNYSIKIPTGGLVCLELQIMDWTAVEPGDAVLQWFIVPRLINAIG